MSTKRPNIVWFSFEDTNPFYGCYGDPTANTPNLDRLAAEGCIFTNCYSTAGVCAPARSAIITGMYPTSIGTHHMRTTHTQAEAPTLPTPYSAVIPHYVRCFTEYLRAAGYYCTNNVKTDYQFEPPITAWDDLSQTAHWRNRPDPDQPFFAVFNPTRTHESGMWEEARPEIDVDPRTVRVPPYFPDTPKVRASLARMHGNIARSDRHLGEILSQLEEDGLADSTIVMHWSDHGPLPRGKRWPYDSGIRVPLIVRWPRGAGNPGAVRTAPGETAPGEAAPAKPAPGGEAARDKFNARATVNAAGGHEARNEFSAAGGHERSEAIERRRAAGDASGDRLPPLRGFSAGSVSDRLVSTLDLGATVLSLAGIPIPRHLHSRAFLGPAARDERPYVFATRDRYDTSYDMVRAVRDRRYKYLQHGYTGEPYLIWVPYRNRHPIMEELWDRRRTGTLAGDEDALFRARPAEELYDTASDPYELRNLADDPAHAQILERMRRAIGAWRSEVEDLGLTNESEMVRRWYPDGVQPTTAAPIFLPYAAGEYGRRAIGSSAPAPEAAVAGGGTPANTPGEVRTEELVGPALLQLQCATQGASIAYRFATDPEESWRLYTGPIQLPSGASTIEACAIRVGYKQSDTARVLVAVDETAT